MVGKILLFILVMVAGFSACSGLPQVRVLHDPLTPKEHVTLGLAYEMDGHRELAAREYHTALAQEHGYVPALVGLGNLAFADGALQESEIYYRQALTTAPEDPGVNNNLAMLYLTRGTEIEEEAERLALRALAQGGPLQPYVLDTLAHIYMRQGRYKEAKATLEDAEAVAPSEDNVLHERLIRLRDQLRGIYSQAGRRDTGETAGPAQF